jgi:hypothetical protein
MIGRKEKPYVDRLKNLASRLGFVAYENNELARYAEGHYLPDLVWKKDGKTVGFEVESGDVVGKKVAGDAFWLCRTFEVGFIQIVNKERLGRFEKLIAYLSEDFKNKVYVVSADLEKSTDLKKIEKILRAKGLVG